MKRFFNVLTAVFAMLLLVATGCKRESAGFDPEGPSGSDETVGYISFEDTALSVSWEGENVNNPVEKSSTRAGVTDVNQFTVEVVKCDTGEVETSFRYGTRGRNPLPLPLGRYYLNVYSGVAADVAWEDDQGQPTYGARSSEFDILVTHTAQNPQRVGEIKCTLQSVKVTVSMEQSMAIACENTTGGPVIEVTLADTRTAKFDKSNAHRYGVVTLKTDDHGVLLKPEQIESTVVAPKAAFLKAEEGESSLILHFEAKYEGTPVSQDITISSRAKAGEWRKIMLYIDKGQSELVGHIVINAVVENWVYDERVEVDVTSGTYAEDSIPDIDDPDAPRIESPYFTFDDVTYITGADYDSAGNYNKPSTITVSTTSQTSRFAVRISSDNPTFSSFLSSAQMLNTSIDLIDNTNSATLLARTQLKNWGFPSRDQILDNPSVTTFDIADMLKFMKDFEGEHTVIVAVTDSENHYSRVDMHIDVTADGQSGGDSDAEVSITWPNHNLDTIYTIDESMTCKFVVKAKSGIAKLMGKLGGALAEEITAQDMMPLEFDLCDTETYREGLGEALTLFRIPNNDEVKGKTSVDLDITGFLPIFPEGESEFGLEVTSETGETATATIRLKR